MRIRIALVTAIAVIAIPVVTIIVFSTTPAASARAVRHAEVGQPEGGQQRPAGLNLKLMSYAQARAVSTMVTFAAAVEKQREETYLKEITYLQSIAQARQEQAAAQAAAAARAVAVPRVQAPAPAPAPVTAAASGGASDATSTDTADWACIRQHESGDNYSEGGGGAYQFELGTWSALTGLPSPAEDYPPAVQDAAALKLYAERGFEPWTTRYVCGL